MSDTERESRVGSQVGPYRLRRLLGKGGMGEVYEAEDTVKDRIVALKLLPESASHDPVFRKRLQREAHSAGRLQEPHVVPIHDYGEVDGLLYVDMRMIDGTDLRKVLKRFGPMTPARAVAIVRQIASALDAAHESGVMHRDVKPENIILTRDDFAYLVDFGIANAATDEKLTELGTAVGTYAYMAPERFTNDEVTYRADVYALACVLHECLTGSQPYPGDSVSVVITAHLMQPIPKPSEERPGIPAAFDQVIARGMAKKPEDRYASAGDLAMAANDALTDRDQDQAATILQRSTASTLPGPPTPVEPPARPIHQTPPPTPPPMHRATPAPTPPPTARPVAFHTPPPPTSGPPSGPMSSGPPSGPMWTAPPASPRPPGPPARKGIPWVSLAAAAAVFVLVLGALGIFWLVKPDETSTPPVIADPPISTTDPTSTTDETTTTTTPSVDPDSFDGKLLGMLPRGYDEGVCQPVHPPAAGALATVDCGPASPTGGPTVTRYSLFADQQTLDKNFDEGLKLYDVLMKCPGSDADSPTTWHFTDTPDNIEGRIACGTYKGNGDVFWTRNGQLLLGDAQGPNLEDLHNWWLKFG
jgi:serine/threonine kinase PknH